MQAVKDLKKSETNEEKRKEAQKAINKEYNQKIYGEILSKEQRLVLRDVKIKLKGKKTSDRLIY